MPKRFNFMPQCPNCGQRRSHVVLTTEALNGKHDIIRRRHCYNCDHRWYTGQLQEVNLAGVEWTGNGKLINMSWSQ